MACRKERAEGEQAFVAELKGKAKKDVKRRLEQIGETGAWLTVAPNKLAGNLLSAEEWRDNARLRYGMRPLGLCDRCDGCGARFTVEHALQCSKGGLVVLRHDNVQDEAGELCSNALAPSRVSYEPPIFYGTDVLAGQRSGDKGSQSKPRHDAPGDEARGDVLVYGLWRKGQGCVLDVRVTDTDAKSYQSSSSAKVLEAAAKAKRDKYAEACIERRRTFTPLVYSVDGMACKEARAWEKRVASLLSTKYGREYSEMAGYVRARMSLAVVRQNTLLLRGARSRPPRPSIGDGASFEVLRGGREL